MKRKPSGVWKTRTVLTDKQLNILMTCYNAQPRPDLSLKEQLAEMTGLKYKVIRVWFQNQRCKVCTVSISRAVFNEGAVNQVSLGH